MGEDGLSGPRVSTKLHIRDSIGEEILLGLEQTYMYTVDTTMDSELVVLSASEFEERFRSLPEVWSQIREAYFNRNEFWAEPHNRKQEGSSGRSSILDGG